MNEELDYRLYYDSVSRIAGLAERSKILDGETARLRERMKTHDEPESKAIRGKQLRRHDDEQNAIAREVESLSKTIDEIRARCPELPEPFAETMSARRRVLSHQLSAKRMERGRMVVLMNHGDLASEARACRVRELDGDVAYYTRLLQEAAEAADDTL